MSDEEHGGRWRKLTKTEEEADDLKGGRKEGRKEVDEEHGGRKTESEWCEE